ncbi:hypothetical protein, partial [Xylella fastidiosa]|uniref:hypothetical protein n=1 Tax=Xylella fastidiosa TaxID=2371 RepID=UPI0019310356
MDPTRRMFSMAAIAAAALASGAGAMAQSPAPIKVGVILPLSGGAGPQGQHVTEAIQAMASLISAAM